MPPTDPDALALAVAYAMRAREGTGPAWGTAIEGAGAGWARVSMAVRAGMVNGHGVVHGGMVFALADTAFAYACNGGNRAAVSASASIVHLAPARAGDVLVAHARRLSHRGRSGVYAVTVAVAGEPVAEFLGHARETGGAVLEGE